jgi:hypothetical protein
VKAELKARELEGLLSDKSVIAVWIEAALEDGDIVYFSLERARYARDIFVMLDEDKTVLHVFPLNAVSAREILEAALSVIESVCERKVVNVKFEKTE